MEKRDCEKPHPHQLDMATFCSPMRWRALVRRTFESKLHAADDINFVSPDCWPLMVRQLDSPTARPRPNLHLFRFGMPETAARVEDTESALPMEKFLPRRPPHRFVPEAKEMVMWAPKIRRSEASRGGNAGSLESSSERPGFLIPHALNFLLRSVASRRARPRSFPRRIIPTCLILP
jgi:hypothetical protein